MGLFELYSRIDAPVHPVFEWHSRSAALERLLPPWQHIQVLEQRGGVESGARVVLRVRYGPLRIRWVSVRRRFQQDRLFVEEQVEGPFTKWSHEHRFEPHGPDACIITDRVSYRIPGGGVGEDLVEGMLQRLLHRIFQFRHARLRRDLRRHGRFLHRDRLRVVISGASGLIGRQLDAFLTTGGHQVKRLVRRRPDRDEGEIFWDPVRGDIDAGALEGADAVIHLAGESIGSGLWTASRRSRILGSRVDGTRLLAETLARLRRPPGALLAASATGYYGDRADELMGEDSSPGHGFLAEVCRAWEEATRPAADAGIRVVNLRVGLVLTAAGGALATQLLPFRIGLGGPVGDGRQYLSWIAMDDLIGVFHHALFDEACEGPLNAVSPEPVTHAEFARTLGRVMKRPALLPLPAPLVRLALGEMGQELLLASTRVAPKKLTSGRFPFQFPDLEPALRFELGRL